MRAESIASSSVSFRQGLYKKATAPAASASARASSSACDVMKTIGICELDGSQLTLKIQSTHAWHPDIKKQAIRIVQFIRVQELASRRETVRAHANGAQQVVKRVPDKIVIVYN